MKEEEVAKCFNDAWDKVKDSFAKTEKEILENRKKSHAKLGDFLTIKNSPTTKYKFKMKDNQENVPVKEEKVTYDAPVNVDSPKTMMRELPTVGLVENSFEEVEVEKSMDESEISLHKAAAKMKEENTPSSYQLQLLSRSVAKYSVQNKQLAHENEELEAQRDSALKTVVEKEDLIAEFIMFLKDFVAEWKELKGKWFKRMFLMGSFINGIVTRAEKIIDRLDGDKQ